MREALRGFEGNVFEVLGGLGSSVRKVLRGMSLRGMCFGRFEGGFEVVLRGG